MAQEQRKSSNFLPEYFQTDKNKKFLSSTLDQFFQTPKVKRVSGYVGNKTTRTYDSSVDYYLDDNTSLKSKYQLEPTVVLSSVNRAVKSLFGFDDLVNQLSYHGANIDNFNQLFAPKVRSYDPHINWDKLVNFNEYYWLPTGPDTVTIFGAQRNSTTTYSVKENSTGEYFVFDLFGQNTNPVLTFYRGQTYVLNVDTRKNFYIKYNNQPGDEGKLEVDDGVTNNGTNFGQIIFTVGQDLEDQVFYVSEDASTSPGTILIRDITEDTFLNVEQDIIGKQYYTAGNGIEFVNGLKIVFSGNVTPSQYLDKEYIVEGVGDSITLVDFSSLITPEAVASMFDDRFDTVNFDIFPFDNFKNVPLVPEYVTINRASQDLNAWSRYNRWFHSQAIKAGALANNKTPVLPLELRAQRPIVEFKPNIQLYNFSTKFLSEVDLFDDTTTDVFSFIEGQEEYTIDGVDLSQGQLIVFTKDTDPLVKGKVFQSTVSIIDGVGKINLVEVNSASVGSGIIVNSGNTYQGTEWWFDGNKWNKSQSRRKLNQAPLFDLFDDNGNSFSDKNFYQAVFEGNQIFGYARGSGPDDNILGFPLKFRDLKLTGTYLFENYFNSQQLTVLVRDTVLAIPNSKTYLRINGGNNTKFANVWSKTTKKVTPVEQFQTLESSIDDNIIIPITVFDSLDADTQVVAYINSQKIPNSSIDLNTDTLRVLIRATLPIRSNILLRFYTKSSPNNLGEYQTPINLTNNPLNGPIKEFTLSELSDHVASMIELEEQFSGDFPGTSNLDSLPNVTELGTRLVINSNPLVFSQLFISDIKNNIPNAIKQVCADYYQFKLSLINTIGQIADNANPDQILDVAISELIKNKNSSFPYSQCDMLAYGSNAKIKNYTVSDSRNVNYPLLEPFDTNLLSVRSVLVYLNGKILVLDKDYEFDPKRPVVRIKAALSKGDVLTVKDYSSTVGSYVPPTPSKLGLYPKYQPEIFVDDNYLTPQLIIQGHDGSQTLAYTTLEDFYDGNIDFRDLALYEYEARVYNNIKTEYKTDLFDVRSVLPSVSRGVDTTSIDTAAELFFNWALTYGLDPYSNNTYQSKLPKTFNFRGTVDVINGTSLPGGWKGIYQYYFDTDRPNTHPWEILGFTVKPTWWEQEYGPAPYSSKNIPLWQDIEIGLIRQGTRAGIDAKFARPGIFDYMPVDEHGDLVDFASWSGIAFDGFIPAPSSDWIFGDVGPVEAAWRRSSIWPFAVQLIAVLANPADYCSLMFDTSRMIKDATGEYNYGEINDAVRPSSVVLHTQSLTSGYNVLVVETGKIRNQNYASSLKEELASVDLRLSYKVSGFTNKEKLQILIDSVTPTSAGPGSSLPAENFQVVYNVSNPVTTLSISGIIVENKGGKYLIKGYDQAKSYFEILQPVHKNSDKVLTVGGKSSAFVDWAPNRFYQKGQIVKFSNSFYQCIRSVNSGASFDISQFVRLPQLPVAGGASVLVPTEYETKITKILYGQGFDTVQQIFDIIVGYGQRLKKLGLVFDYHAKEINEVIDFTHSAKEFLFWSTQNWGDGSVITLSPFSKQIVLDVDNATIDAFSDSFYNNTLLNASGIGINRKNISISRDKTQCTVSTKETNEGIYFARLNLVQKEHVLVLDNSTIFNDTVYSIETGYRQPRVKILGFITDDWSGDYINDGFIYDAAEVVEWKKFQSYIPSQLVRYSGKIYSAKASIPPSDTFNSTQWTLIRELPVADLYPNIDYKIEQFGDFYSQDIDNFDTSQQKMAQQLIGYTPRPYLSNIIIDPISQYKFYQGFIREKGTANAISKLSKVGQKTATGLVEYSEDWALRVGAFGSYTTQKEIEFPLRESEFFDSVQILKLTNQVPDREVTTVSYITDADLTIKYNQFDINSVFDTYNSLDDIDTTYPLPLAGYARLDDVFATAYNTNSLLDIGNNAALQEGNVIWLGFRKDGEWDALRYTQQPFTVIGSEVVQPARTLRLYSNVPHNLLVGDIISIVGGDNDIDSVYEVNTISSSTAFVVNTDLAFVTPQTTTATVHKFISSRVSQFDDIVELGRKVTLVTGDNVWCDIGTGTSENLDKWAVFQKQDNFELSSQIPTPLPVADQKFGFDIQSYSTSKLFLSTAPKYFRTNTGYGRVFAFNDDNGKFSPITDFGLTNPALKNIDNNFGYSVAYDPASEIVITGAPNANLIQINQIERETLSNEYYGEIIGSTSTNARFGSEIFISKNKNSQLGQVVAVAAPGIGKISLYSLITETKSLSPLSTLSVTASTSTDYIICGTDNADTLLVANTADGAFGTVKVYSVSGQTYTNVQTLTTTSTNFGSSVSVSSSGNWAVVSDLTTVYVYKKVDQEYQLVQTLASTTDTSFNYGTCVELNDAGNFLAVSITSKTSKVGTIDLYERKNHLFVYSRRLEDSVSKNVVNNQPYPNSLGKNLLFKNSTLYVSATTAVGVDTSKELGIIYQFKTKDPLFLAWNTLRSQPTLVNFSSITRVATIDYRDDDLVDYLEIFDPAKGKISGLAEQELSYKTVFDPAVYTVGDASVSVDFNTSWVDNHVGELWWDLSTIKYQWYEQGDDVFRRNSWGKLFPGATIDVYEWVKTDLLPSQWSALADTTEGLAQGVSGQPKHSDNSIISVSQFFNPATGETNNVYYYWVKNKVILPNIRERKLSAAETARLIFDPIGQGQKTALLLSPNSIAIANIKSSLVDNYVHLNIYQEDRKNNVRPHTEWALVGESYLDSSNPDVIPINIERKLFDSLVGQDLLGNPVPDPALPSRLKYGIDVRPRQSMFVDKNQAVRNLVEYVNTVIKNHRISDLASFVNLNSMEPIPDDYSSEYDIIVNEFDDLSDSLIKNYRRAKVRAEVSDGRIINVIIEDGGQGYGKLIPAQINSQGTPVTWRGPKITIQGDTTGIGLYTEVDSNGTIVLTAFDLKDVVYHNLSQDRYLNLTLDRESTEFDFQLTTFDNLVNLHYIGNGYTSIPDLVVRDYVAVVRSDENSSGYWAKYEYSKEFEMWTKIQTQNFDTTRYWEYQLWASPNYDAVKPIVATVDELFQVNALTVNSNDYVKVNNQGNGTFIILEKTKPDVIGNFNDDYDLVASEAGTIKFKDTLWNLKENEFNFDVVYTFDQTLYDQTPERELRNILRAIKEDIFVGNLKHHWNKLFFKLVRYAISEQKNVDWAFKTSLINVKNIAGALEQKPVFKFQDAENFRKFVEEAKPYHSHIRNYQVEYQTVDPASTSVSDFDLPSFFDETDGTFRAPTLDDFEIDLDPWSSWRDNYTLSLGAVTVVNPGKGYTGVPTVTIIPAFGDSGVDAQAVAQLSQGKVVAIQVTNPGQGYTKVPSVVISGGNPAINATAYPNMVNNKVRGIKSTLLFDRISYSKTLSNELIVDKFIADGFAQTFRLSWAANSNKSKTRLLVNDRVVSAFDYEINTTVDGIAIHTDLEIGPILQSGDQIHFEYYKNIEIFDAVDRIEEYYHPNVGMPSKVLDQLMSGISYPGAEVTGLKFNDTEFWDTDGYGQSDYGDLSSNYSTATISVFASAGDSTILIDNAQNVEIGQRISVISTDKTNLVIKKVEKNTVVTAVDRSSNFISLSTPLVDSMFPGTVLLEFWNFNQTPKLLDTQLDGGTLSYNTAVGVNPSEVIVDGDSFISEFSSHAPEEFLPGQVNDTIGINVYTRVNQGSPLIIKNIFNIEANTSTVYTLPFTPANTASVFVSVDGQGLDPVVDYDINFSDQTISINPQENAGTVCLTTVGVGGVGFLSHDIVKKTIESSVDKIELIGICDSRDVGTVYVTLNGVTLSNDEYQLTTVSDIDLRPKIVIENLSAGNYTAQCWFFGLGFASYSEIKEQLLTSDGGTTEYQLDGLTNLDILTSSQAIVEIGGRRLIPPNSVYYMVSDASVTDYQIDPHNIRPLGAYGMSDVQVLVNGANIRKGIDFVIDQTVNTVKFKPNVLKIGDAIAIANSVYSEYYFDGNLLKISPQTQQNIGEIIKVITFIDTNGTMMTTETYKHRSNHRYPVNYEIVNSQYVWVSINNRSLTSSYDYYYDATTRSIVIDSEVDTDTSATIVVTSFNQTTVDNAIGFRMFTDILGRTQYKRLSIGNSTQLEQDLHTTSTEIVLKSAQGIQPPTPEAKIPGVILINGERIEFNQMNGNVLSQLRRATLGTGAKLVYKADTRVVDQSFNQNLPFVPQQKVQKFSCTNLSQYFLNGFVLSGDNLQDQVEVYYGGRLLRKAGIFVQDVAVSIDIVEYKLKGAVETTEQLPATENIGDAYLISSTNHVWIYTNSLKQSAVKGYEYTGINYLPEEFTIGDLTTIDNETVATLTFLFPIVSGTRVRVVQHQLKSDIYANTLESLITDAGIVAGFLREQQSPLPDKYHYGI